MTALATRSSPTRPRVWPPLVLALLVLGSWVWLRLPARAPEPEPHEVHEPAPAPAPPEFSPYEAEARALLGGLDHADPLALGWVVERVEGPLDDGRIKLTVRQDERQFAVWIATRGASERPAPTQTERWEFFYDRPQPLGAKVELDEFTAVLEAIAARVRAHE